jgi:hypothetical protein
MYSDKEFDFIDKLLRDSLNNDYTYEKLCYTRNFDYDLYNKLFTDINKEPYKLIELHENSFVVTQLGRHVAIEGFEKYLNDLKDEQETDKSIKRLTLADLQKTDKRSKISFWLSVFAIIVALFVGVLDYIKPEKPQDNTNKNTSNTKNNTDIDSEINHSQNPSNFIDTTSIKIFSDSSKH